LREPNNPESRYDGWKHVLTFSLCNQTLITSIASPQNDFQRLDTEKEFCPSHLRIVHSHLKNTLIPSAAMVSLKTQ